MRWITLLTPKGSGTASRSVWSCSEALLGEFSLIESYIESEEGILANSRTWSLIKHIFYKSYSWLPKSPNEDCCVGFWEDWELIIRGPKVLNPFSSVVSFCCRIEANFAMLSDLTWKSFRSTLKLRFLWKAFKLSSCGLFYLRPSLLPSKSETP